MATHSSILAWRILGMGEPDGLLSMGSHRVGHDWSDLAAAAAAAAEFTPSQGLGNHTELLCWKRPWCWERLRQEEKETTEDEMVGWHHRLNGHEFEQTPGDSEGHGSLLCCSPWGEKELDTTEWLNKQWQNSILAWKIPRTEEPERLQKVHAAAKESDTTEWRTLCLSIYNEVFFF